MDAAPSTEPTRHDGHIHPTSGDDAIHHRIDHLEQQVTALAAQVAQLVEIADRLGR